MLRNLSLAIAGMLLFSLVGSAAAPAPATGPNIALPYPAKAPLVVHLNGLERARERLAKMLEALPPAEAKNVKRGIESGLAELLKGRKLDAVPKDGRVFFVLHDITKLIEGEPAISFLIPVSGYKEFKESLLTAEERKTLEKGANGIETVKFAANDETLYLVDLKNYVAVSPSKDTAEMYAGKYSTAQSGSMGADLSASFLNADVSVYVNMDVINDIHGEQIRQGRAFMDFALGQAQGMLPGFNKQQMELAKTMIGGVFQAVEDSKGIVLAAEFRAEGLNLRGQIRFADDSMSGDVLKAESPTALPGIAKLPKGLNTYGGMKFGKKFSDLGKKFTQEFLAADDDEKGAERIAKLQGEILAAGSLGDYSASRTPEASLTVSAYKDAAKATDATIKLYEGLGEGGKFATIVLKEKPRVIAKAATHRDISFTEVRMSFDFAATVEAMPEPAREAALSQFKRLMNEKTTIWIGTDGKSMISLTAKNWDAAKSLLDDYLEGKSGIGTDAGFQIARKNLPAEASMLYLLETGQVVTLLVEQAKAVGEQIPGGAFPPIGKVKPVGGDATYIGFAMVLKPQIASVDLFVPGASMNVMAKMIAPLFRNVE